MWNLAYNIHDLVKININGTGPEGLGAGLKYSFFKSERNNDPDIILNIGKFYPSNYDCHILSHKYYVKNNYFYCKDKGKAAKWELEVFGFETGKTVINFNGKNSGIKGKLFPAFLAQEFLLPFIEYKLAQKGCLLLHSGAVSKNRGGFIFAGRMGSFKTTLIMDLIRRGNFSYLGDDRVIIDGDSIICFPTSLFLFDFMLRNGLTEKRNLINNFHLLYHLLNSDKPKNVQICSFTHQRGIVFISRNDIAETVITNLTRDTGINKLKNNNKLELTNSIPSSPSEHFFKYTLFYSLIFPDNSLSNYWINLKDKLMDSLQEIPMYEIRMPKNYNIEIYNDIYQFLEAVA